MTAYLAIAATAPVSRAATESVFKAEAAPVF